MDGPHFYGLSPVGTIQYLEVHDLALGQQRIPRNRYRACVNEEGGFAFIRLDAAVAFLCAKFCDYTACHEGETVISPLRSVNGEVAFVPASGILHRIMARGRPVIRRRSQHGISRKDIDEDALKVMYRLNRHGHKAYLVGGGVRDLLLGREPKDFDVSTDAEPRQIKKLFRNCFLVGRRFRLAHIRFGYHKIIETSTFRRQPDPLADPNDPDASLLHTDDNEFGTPEEDAKRRDFTINGMFYDLKDFSIIDHVGGLNDLKKGIIRSIGDPNVRFREDPVRMLRAVRFASRLGFRIETRTYRAIRRHYAEITEASPARLLEETYRLFAFHAGEPAFFLLWQTKLLSVMFPEVDEYLAENGKDHAPLWRLLAALDSGEHWDGEPTPALMFAALLCDPIARQAENHKVARDRAAFPRLVSDLVEPIAIRCRMPKGVRYRLIRILSDQLRLDGALDRPPQKGHRRRGGSPRRMAQQEAFGEAKALLEIRAAAGVAEPKVLAYWDNLCDEMKREGIPIGSVLSRSGRGAAGPAQRERPKPRRRRRRKPRHEAPRT
jgi:poly(A) polymerase